MSPILQIHLPPKPSRSWESPKTFNDSWHLLTPGAVLWYFVDAVEDGKNISLLLLVCCKAFCFAVFLCWQREIIRDKWHISFISDKLFTSFSRVSCESDPSPQINNSGVLALISIWGELGSNRGCNPWAVVNIAISIGTFSFYYSPWVHKVSNGRSLGRPGFEVYLESDHKKDIFLNFTTCKTSILRLHKHSYCQHDRH